MRSIWTAVVVASLLALGGCGGSASSTLPPTPQLTIVSGNWGMSLTTQPTPPLGLILASGGVINQNGNTLSGIIHLQGSTCFDPQLDDLTVSGTITGTTLTLTSAPLRGQVLSMSVTPPANQVGDVKALSGMWTLTGGSCAGSGTILMVSVPPLTGTWSGPITNAATGTVSATLTQTGPDAHGFFQVTGSFAFSAVPCFTSGSIVSSMVTGLEADILLNTNEPGQAEVTIIHDPNPSTERLLTSVIPSLSVTCSGNFVQATLNKQ